MHLDELNYFPPAKRVVCHITMVLRSKFPSLSNQLAINFLEQNPSLSHCLLADCNNDLNRVTTLIEPILQASHRCELTSCYIQALTTGRVTFLTTNLSRRQPVQVTATGSSWLIGRHPTSAIAVPDNSISRRHAVISYCSDSDFYITDIGSSNGTWVNYRKLAQLDRWLLRDGDLIQLGSLKLEFFIIGYNETHPAQNEVTRY